MFAQNSWTVLRLSVETRESRRSGALPKFAMLGFSVFGALLADCLSSNLWLDSFSGQRLLLWIGGREEPEGADELSVREHRLRVFQELRRQGDLHEGV